MLGFTSTDKPVKNAMYAKYVKTVIQGSGRYNRIGHLKTSLCSHQRWTQVPYPRAQIYRKSEFG